MYIFYPIPIGSIGFYQGVKFLEHSQLLKETVNDEYIKIRAIAQLQEEELKDS